MKKNNIFKFIALFLAGSFILAACKKDDTTPPAPDKATKLIFNWKITNIVTNKIGHPELDSTLYKDCMADDVIKFTNTGFDFQDGASKCDSSIFNYSKGTWAYKIASDSILLSAAAPVKYTSWKVITLNDSILKVQYTDSSNLAKKINKTISFKH